MPAYQMLLRLHPDTLSRVDDLATSTATPDRPGNRSAAVRECVHYWHRSVVDACVTLAERISPDDWLRLAMVGLPAVEPGDYPHWGVELAEDLRDAAHRHPERERAELRRLAGVLGRLSLAEGWGVAAALRWHAAHPDEPRWWRPECWLGADREDATGGDE